MESMTLAFGNTPHRILNVFKKSFSKHGVAILKVNVWVGGREFGSSYVDLAVGSGSEVKSELDETEEWVLSSRE
jgi:hypothetical protein